MKKDLDSHDIIRRHDLHREGGRMKPSERIKEIARDIIKEKKGLDLTKATHVLDLRIECIERYLDEQSEKERHEKS